jgi:phospholipase C
VRRAAFLIVLACLALAGSAHAATNPPIKHVFVIVLENKNYDVTFGPTSKAPYLSKTLVSRGQLLTQYYGTGHHSLDNYISMVSGQGPNPQTQADCQFYTDFLPGTIGPNGQAIGNGCVYPEPVKTVANQLESKHLTWKGYMEDMGAPCRHPGYNAKDPDQAAKADDQYATRHNPFVYFHSITDHPTCAKHDVDLSHLQSDLRYASTTPNLSFITPDLCSDGHDTGCPDGRPGGYLSIDAFLKTWVPLIRSSPAYKKDGVLLVTFDESESGSESCCAEPTGPNSPNNGGTDAGDGGGRTGAVVLSPYVRPGIANDKPYNHYSLLRSIEDTFGLGHLGYAAQAGLKPFGSDVYNRTSPPAPAAIRKPKIRISGVPKGCVRRAFRARIRITSARFGTARVLLDGHQIARRKHKSFSVRISVAKRRAGRHLILVRASQRQGPKAAKRARFGICKHR